MDQQLTFENSEYRGAEKRDAVKDIPAPSKIKALKKHPRIHKRPLNIEYMKASIRAKVKHPFRVIKCPFGFTKARYRSLMKNDGKLENRHASGEKDRK